MGCGCSRRFILDEMYLCNKCQKPLCRFCLSEEVDSFFCNHCAMSYSHSEAGLYKNKCGKYLQCPVCSITL